MVTDWRIKDGLQLQKQTLKDGWVDSELNEAPSAVQNSIEEQKIKDDLYQVEYKNVDKNGVEDAFVIPFKEPLDDCIVKSVFEKDSTSYAEKIEDRSGKSLDELIKTELVTDGEIVYESKGFFYFVKRFFNIYTLIYPIPFVIPMTTLSSLAFVSLREELYSLEYYIPEYYSPEHHSPEYYITEYHSIEDYVLGMTFGDMFIIMSIFFMTLFLFTGIIVQYLEMDYITFDKLF